MKNTNSDTEVKTNTHDTNLNTNPARGQAASALCEQILLGIDQHAADLRIVRQLDGAGPQPPQRVYPGADLERFIGKQLSLAQRVYALYEAGPCGFGLARQLKAWGVEVHVMRPMKLDVPGKGVATDKTDAAELVSRLDRYLAGNHKAFAPVRVPSPEEEQRRCVSRQREQLRRERQRLAAQGRSLCLTQGGSKSRKGLEGARSAVFSFRRYPHPPQPLSVPIPSLEIKNRRPELSDCR